MIVYAYPIKIMVYDEEYVIDGVNVWKKKEGGCYDHHEMMRCVGDVVEP